jgi:hypothetical protein
MLAILCPVNSHPVTIHVDDNIESLRGAIQEADIERGGSRHPVEYLEAVTLNTPRGPFTVYCDEEALYHFREVNRLDFYGPFLIMGNVDEEGGNTGLTGSDIDFLMGFIYGS